MSSSPPGTSARAHGHQRGTRIEQVLDRVEHDGRVERARSNRHRFRRLAADVQAQLVDAEFRGFG